MGLSIERRREIDRVFSEALDRPDEELTRFLDLACAGDEDLRARVEALLEEDDGTDTLFETAGEASLSLMRSLASDLSQDREKVEGSRIGPYRIVRELGRGGMAVVYLGERVDGTFERQVAIKLIQRGLDSEERIHRFLTERQILASLQHPNIAALLDGGISEQGRPYFTMEWIDGRPIDQYVQEQDLAIDERLRLFVSVGRAVQAAHQRLVVHRDLKPNNILVTGDGVPKLLDFGIAKLLAAENSTHTRSSLRLLTPEFSSPEQVLGEPITTATDVYQLGLLLYLLLTDRSPQMLGTGSLVDVHRVVCEKVPTRPSTAVAEVVDVKDKVRVRQVARRRRRLQGDLDTIVLKALRKDPAERYDSVAQLVDDVERFLDDRPIMARGPSWTYRTGKVLWRYKLATFSAVSILLLTLLYTAWVVEERDRAAEAARRAETMTAALENLLSFDLYSAKGGQITVQELLDRSILNIERDLAQHPETQHRLRNLIARVYRRLGAHDAAEAQHRLVLEEAGKALGDDHLEVGRAKLGLGRVLDSQNRFRDARNELVEALAFFEASPEPAPAEIAETLRSLSRLAWVYKEYEEAHALSIRALQIQETLVGGEDERLVDFLAARADVFVAEKNPRAALPFLRWAAGLYDQDEPPARAAPILAELGFALYHSGMTAEAIGYLERSRDVTQATLGPDHPASGRILVGLGRAFGAEGREQACLDALRAALDNGVKNFGESSPTTLISAVVLGEHLQRFGRLEEAEGLFRKILDVVEGSLGAGSIHAYSAIYNLAHTLDLAGKDGEALPLYERVVALLAAEPDHAPDVLRETRRHLERLRGGGASPS